MARRSHTKKKTIHTGNLVQVNCLFIIIAIVVVVFVQHSLVANGESPFNIKKIDFL